jgi:DNA repair protein RecO (recombination protein O)
VTTLSSETLEAIRALASPGGGWRELAFGPKSKGLAAVHQTVGAVMSHVLGHRPKVRPYLGV